MRLRILLRFAVWRVSYQEHPLLMSDIAYLNLLCCSTAKGTPFLSPMRANTRQVSALNCTATAP